MNMPVISLGLVIALVPFSLTLHELLNHFSAQQKECECRKIRREGDEKITIDYERVSKRVSKKENDTVWFRLYNGTRCPIYLPTDHEYTFRASKGDIRFDIQDGSVVFVKYKVKRAGLKEGKEVTDYYPWISYLQGSTFATSLPSGSSLLFYVPIANLKQHSHLAVPYTCRKDEKFDSDMPQVEFPLNKLPDSVFQSK